MHYFCRIVSAFTAFAGNKDIRYLGDYLPFLQSKSASFASTYGLTLWGLLVGWVGGWGDS